MASHDPSKSARDAEVELAALRERVAALERDLGAAAERERHATHQIAALRASDGTFSTVFEHAPFGIVLGSLDDSLLRTNNAFEQITGYTAEELMRLSVGGITPPEDYACEVPLIEDLLAGRRTHYRLEKRYCHKQGHLVPVMITGLVVRDDTGAPRACVALVEDQTERHKAEEMRRHLAAILEISPDFVGYMDLDGRIQYLNRAWRRLHAIPDGADLTALDATGWQPEWAMRLAVEVGIPAAKRHGFWQGETVVYDPDGGEMPVRQTILAIHDQNGQLARLATVLHNMTNERRATQSRLDLERKLLESQRLESLGVMAAGIAHDFNNILTTILGNTDLALLSPELDEQTRQSLEAVVEGAHRATELTRQILAYAGKGRVMLQPLDLNRTIVELEELLRGSAGRRSRLRLELGEALPLVEADSAQIRQVLLNLVINAGEAIEAARPDGQIVLSTAAEELGRRQLDGLVHGADLPEGQYVRLTVEDNGCGMDASTAARIFDPFFSTKFLGRGLGLAAVQGIVRVHLGGLVVASQPGAGTRFSVWLPAWGQSEEAPRPRDGHHGRHGHVLIVEPDPATRAQLATFVRKLGLRAVGVADDIAALARLAAGLPQLEAAIIATDAPGGQAKSVTQAVESMRPGTPALLLGPGGDLARPPTFEELRRRLSLARSGSGG